METYEGGAGRTPESQIRDGGASGAVTRTVNGTGHTGPSEFCATSI